MDLGWVKKVCRTRFVNQSSQSLAAATCMNGVDIGRVNASTLLVLQRNHIKTQLTIF